MAATPVGALSTTCPENGRGVHEGIPDGNGGSRGFYGAWNLAPGPVRFLEMAGRIRQSFTTAARTTAKAFAAV
ncbi:hypothetical protein GCM10009416_18660 [Craurococcus roseus]|uniref:Uncharacterized protein n=1 Tax=Craurococcus roseus TaxID=77585 RepID=A0ABP3Q5M9_9PROT